MARSAKKMAPLAPPKNLTGALVARLTEEINSGHFAPNEKLPTEQEMIASFGVSRTVVREAVAALRSEGLVQSRQGSGVFVTGDLSRRPFRIDPDGLQTIQGVLDVMELRMAVEIEAAGIAAERRTKRDLERIERSLHAFERSIAEGEDGVEADYQFHLSIAQATQNPNFDSFIEFLGRRIIPRRSIQVEREDDTIYKAYLSKVLSEHRSIFKAIERQDATTARRTMRSHLGEGRKRYLKFARD